MNRFILMSIFLTLLQLSATARLGETEAQLVERFGKAKSRTVTRHITQGKILDLCPRLIFRQEGWTITVELVGGKSAREHYGKKGDWTEAQFRAVLDSNRQGARWSDLSDPAQRGFIRKWKRSDGATVTWSKPSPTMVVTHPNFLKARRRLDARAKAEASKIPKL